MYRNINNNTSPITIIFEEEYIITMNIQCYIVS